MNRRSILQWCAPALLVASGVLVSAQTIQLPSAPLKQFGASVTPAWDGWFDNADGTHTFLIGYYNRNTDAEIDVPIGPNNKFEPGDIDRGQPTHFLARRHYGVFTVTVPKDFTKTQRITWTLTANGVTTAIPFHLHTDYNVSPFKGSEEAPDGTYDTPPVLHFDATGPSFQGPVGTIAKAVSRTAAVGTPMPLEIFTEDDARFSGGGTGPTGPVVTANVSKYRGPGKVTVTNTTPAPARGAGGRGAGGGPGGGGGGGGRGGGVGGAGSVTFETLQGGKPMEPFKGKGTANISFSEAGEYFLQVTGNDYSGNGGGGSVCCWTTAMLKVAVK